MSLASQLADIIRQEAHTRGQLGIAKAGIIPNAISQGANTLQGALNQMTQNKAQDVRNDFTRSETDLNKVRISKAQRDEQNEREIEAILKAIPDGPDAMRLRTEAFVKFWQAKDPQKALEIQKSLRGEGLVKAQEEAARATRAYREAQIKKLEQADKPATFDLGPGHKRVDETGKEIASNPAIDKADVKLGETITSDNKKIAKFRRSDGTTYTEEIGDARTSAESGGGAEPGSYIPLTDDQGRVIGAWNPKARRVEEVPKDFAGARKSAIPFEDRRARANARSGLRAIDTVESILKDPAVLAQASIPGSIGARKFAAARREMVDVITRLRTGAALNEGEQKFYHNQAPTLLDLTDKEAIAYKIGLFRDLFNDLATGGEDVKAKASTPATGGGLTGAQKARLEELRRKKQAGTLGK